MREYNGGSENIACYKAFLRTDSNRDSNAASDHYCYLCFISIRRGLSSSMRIAGALSITQGTLGNSECRVAIARVPLNKDAIGQEGNTHGVLPCSCVTVATAQKHKPKVMYSASRCLRLLRSWSAERKPPFFPPFPLGGKLIPFGHSEVKQTGALGSVELHCELHQ